MTGRTSLAVPLCVGIALAFALAPIAEATFPGTNGNFAYVSDRDGNPEIEVSLPGPGETRVTNHPAADRSPAFNVNGAELAFESDRDGDFEIYRVPARGSAPPTQLTHNSVPDGSPAWAPSSTQLVIVREVAGGDTNLLILAGDGSGATTPLTASAPVTGEVEPNWSANGARIAFSAIPSGDAQRDIFVINPNGTGLTNLTNTPGRDDREPNWAPGNARITYSSFLGSSYDIHIMNADGTGDSNITNVGSQDERDPVWSPDASRILFSRTSPSDAAIFNISSLGQFEFQVALGSQPDWQRVPPPACSDAVDNDGDMLTDYPADPGCTFASDTEENEANPQCSDGIDNDGDFFVDHGSDAGCVSPADTDETNPACNDDIDNDGDGATDYPVDIGCDWYQDDDEANPQCSDTVDNDGDARIDFPNDPDCVSRADTDEQHHDCSDGRDNDGDGKFDLSDPGCESPTDNDETDPITACSDEVDNDGDTKVDYPADPGCTSTIDTDEFNPPPTGFFVRPKSAPSIEVSLVPAFSACANPNRQHGPSLAFPSCNPPAPTSAAVTVGTADANGAPTNSVGSISLTARAGAPGLPEDSDVAVTASITDVRCLPSTVSCGNNNSNGDRDYTAQLLGIGNLRITDRFNANSPGGGGDGATVVDTSVSFKFACANTADPAVGAPCTANTSLNALVPETVKDGKRTVLDLGQLVVYDGGKDGQITAVPDTPDTLFLAQGVFVP